MEVFQMTRQSKLTAAQVRHNHLFVAKGQIARSIGLLKVTEKNKYLPPTIHSFVNTAILALEVGRDEFNKEVGWK
jgi:hypothetical protein